MLTLLLVGILVGLLYAPICLGAGISFRVLSWPDLTLEGGALASAAASVWAISHGFGFFFAIAISVSVGAAAGLLTSTIRFRGGVGPLLASIISASFLYAAFFHLTGGRANVPLPHGEHTIFGLASSRTLTSEIAVALAVVVAMVMTIAILFQTRFGYMLRALGEEPRLLHQLGRSEALLSAAGLAVANGLVGLGTGVVVQYRGTLDVSVVGGLLVSSLASIMLGELIVRPGTMTSFAVAATVGSVLNGVLVALALEASGRTEGGWLLATDVRAGIGALFLACGLVARRLGWQSRLFGGNW